MRRWQTIQPANGGSARRRSRSFPRSAGWPPDPGMLKQRVITAVVLLAILLPALFWRSPEPFAIVTLILIAAGAWEWGRLNGLSPAGAVVAALCCLGLCVASWTSGLLERPLAALWAVV